METLTPTAPRKVKYPVMFQDWSDISFLHWRYPPDSIQRLLPRGLTIDLYDSHAWLGLTPFLVERMRPPFAPPLPWLSRFPETNVRTYVTGPDGSRGIWFFSLEAARGLAVIGANALYGLPYHWARMTVCKQGETLTYRSKRKAKSTLAVTHIVVKTGAPIEATALEIFLTARFRLFSYRGGRLWFADVEHQPWPLSEGRVCCIDQTLLPALSLDEPNGEPLVHYSTGVQTRISKLSLL